MQFTFSKVFPLQLDKPRVAAKNHGKTGPSPISRQDAHQEARRKKVFNYPQLNRFVKGNLIMKRFALVLALFASFSNLSFAAGASATPISSLDGSADVIEAMGGTRNGGDC